jgi:serine/threonine-protein kinase
VSDVLAAVLKTEPDWSGLPAITPVAIRRLLRRCLDRDPRRRLHDIADARIVIEDVVSGVDSGEVGSFGLASVAGARLRRPSLLWLGALGVMAAAAGLGGYFARGRGARAPVPTHLAIQLPADLELLTGALLAFSPDGNSLVSSARQDGKPSLFRRKLSDRVAEPIPGTEGGANAFFSPDGRWIGFSAEGQVRKVASEGGRPFPLGESRGAGGCAWLADGTIVFAPLYSDGLFRMSAEGGVAARLTTPDRKDGQLGHWWPEPLPGGQRVLFTAFRTPVDRSRIGVLDLGTGEVRWVVEGGFFARYVSS